MKKLNFYNFSKSKLGRTVVAGSLAGIAVLSASSCAKNNTITTGIVYEEDERVKNIKRVINHLSEDEYNVQFVDDKVPYFTITEFVYDHSEPVKKYIHDCVYSISVEEAKAVGIYELLNNKKTVSITLK